MAKLFNVIVSKSVDGYDSSTTFPFESKEKARLAVKTIKDKFNEDIGTRRFFKDITIQVNRDTEFQAVNGGGEFSFSIKLEEVDHMYDDDMDSIIPNLSNVMGYQTTPNGNSYSYHIV
jgi:hypothetical protein